MRCIALVSVAMLAACAALASGTSDWRTYKGAWFDIKVPPGFKTVPREHSLSAPGYDGVSFISPDGKMEFYVYSPQWSGSPQWIKLREGETVTSRKTDTRGNRSVTWVTIRGPNGRYTRQYVDTVDSGYNTRLVFGLKYTSEQVYERYRAQYLLFKQSLRQYAD